MPRVDWDAEDAWGPIVGQTAVPPPGAHYMMRDGDPQSPTWGQWYGYGDRWAQDSGRFTRTVERLVNGPLFNAGVEITPHPFTFQSTDRILIAGCGFGYGIQAFKDAGFPDTFGIDKSPHIQNNKSTQGPNGIVLVGEDVTGGGAKNALRNATGDDEFDWVLTESVLESYDNTDPVMSALLDASQAGVYRQFTPPQGNEAWRVIHLVAANPELDPAFNVQSIDAWSSLRTAQSWINYVDWEARIGS
jgi:hypothetical protein